ncbi:sugar:proton symporter [Leptospira ainlahdjerensis]
MKLLITIVFLCVFFPFVFYYFLKNLEYRPKDALNLSDQFLHLLISKKFEKAYAFTNQNAIVGNSYERFQKKIERELGNGGDGSSCDLSITDYYPKQSYGNRFRRFWNRSSVEVDQLHIEYDPCGLPFRISLRLNRNEEWKVVNFQSHAE